MRFEKIYNKYHQELYRFAFQLTFSKNDSEDLVQETFTKYYKELKKDIVFNNPRAWLYKVLLNLAKTNTASKQLHTDKIKKLLNKNKKTNDLLDDYLIKEKRTIVLQMLYLLPEKEKNILLLYHHGLSYTEMAKVLNINPNSVGTTLIRATQKLKKLLKSKYYELFE